MLPFKTEHPLRGTPRVVVIGHARTGTSLMMRTLQLLGLELCGGKLPPNVTGADAIKKLTEGNPDGYWEADLTTADTEGRAVKVSMQKVPVHLRALPPDVPLIVTCRHPGESMLSRETLGWSSKVYVPVYRDSWLSFVDWYDGRRNPILVVDYADMLSDPRKTIGQVAEFLGLETDIKQAVSNVKPSLYRSASGRELFKVPAAVRMYELAKQKDWTALRSIR